MKYDKDDKLDMVLDLLKSPNKAKEIASRYNVAESTLYKWRCRFLSGGKQRLFSYKEKKSSQKEIELTQKVKTYENRISILSAELEISKKKENFLNEELR